MAKSKNDRQVIAAMGSKFESFRRLALHAYNNPNDRAEMEVEMAKILATMSESERLGLRKALIAAGVR